MINLQILESKKEEINKFLKIFTLTDMDFEIDILPDRIKANAGYSIFVELMDTNAEILFIGKENNSYFNKNQFNNAWFAFVYKNLKDTTEKRNYKKRIYDIRFLDNKANMQTLTNCQ